MVAYQVDKCPGPQTQTAWHAQPIQPTTALSPRRGRDLTTRDERTFSTFLRSKNLPLRSWLRLLSLLLLPLSFSSSVKPGCEVGRLAHRPTDRPTDRHHHERHFPLSSPHLWSRLFSRLRELSLLLLLIRVLRAAFFGALACERAGKPSRWLLRGYASFVHHQVKGWEGLWTRSSVETYMFTHLRYYIP